MATYGTADMASPDPHLNGLGHFGNPLPKYNPATDPYSESTPLTDADPDTLANKPSTTPLMGTLSRIGFLVMIGAMLYQRKSARHFGGGTVEGLDYPSEIKIHGVRGSFAGGGAVGRGVVAGLYLAVDRAASDALAPFAGAPADELNVDGFFGTLSDAKLRQSLLLQWTAPSGGDAALALLGDAAGSSSETLTDALRPLLGDAVPEGADLFFTCYEGTLVVAYAGYYTKNVRNTAKVGATLDGTALCPALFGTFLAGQALRRGVAEAFAERSSVWV